MTLWDQIKRDPMWLTVGMNYWNLDIPREEAGLIELPVIGTEIGGVVVIELMHLLTRITTVEFRRLLKIYGYKWTVNCNSDFADEQVIQSFFRLIRCKISTELSFREFLDRFRMRDLFQYNEGFTLADNMGEFALFMKAITPIQVGRNDTIIHQWSADIVD